MLCWYWIHPICHRQWLSPFLVPGMMDCCTFFLSFIIFLFIWDPFVMYHNQWKPAIKIIIIIIACVWHGRCMYLWPKCLFNTIHNWNDMFSDMIYHLDSYSKCYYCNDYRNQWLTFNVKREIPKHEVDIYYGVIQRIHNRSHRAMFLFPRQYTIQLSIL